MRKKVITIICVIIVISVICIIFIKNNTEESEKKFSEYIPEEELSDEDLRNTIVTLYFVNSESGNLEKEARLIDSKELLREPYKVLIGMLIEGPKNASLNSLIPKNTKILETTLKGNCVTINFSKEFLECDKNSTKSASNIIFSIVNTLTELKEVTSVKFLIEGKESDEFSDVGINLKSEFVRK